MAHFAEIVNVEGSHRVEKQSNREDSLRFSNGPSDLIQSSIVIQDVIVGGEGGAAQPQRMFKTAHIRSKFAKIKEGRKESFEGDSDEVGDGFSCGEFSDGESLRNRDELRRIVRDSRVNHESIRDSVALTESKESLGNEQWESEQKAPVDEPITTKNPFKNSELQESLAKARATETTRENKSNKAKLVKSQETSQGDSKNSLIYSNENALKNIIQAHDLKIEESFGKEQIEYFQSKAKALKPQIHQNEEHKLHLDVIPETDGRMIFTLKGKDALKRGSGDETSSREFGSSAELQSLRIRRSPGESLPNRPKGNNSGKKERNANGTVERDPEVDYLMGKLAHVMEAEPEESLEESLAETQLDPKTRKILSGYFRKQEEKFRENQETLKSTYKQLKKEKVHIEEHLRQLGQVYKEQISELEKANNQKDKEIKKLKKKNKLLGIQGKKQKPKSKSKEQSKGELTDKYYSDKLKNLSRLLEEKNRKIKTLNSKIDDLKIDNQAMKELLREFSTQTNG